MTAPAVLPLQQLAPATASYNPFARDSDEFCRILDDCDLPDPVFEVDVSRLEIAVSHLERTPIGTETLKSTPITSAPAILPHLRSIDGSKLKIISIPCEASYSPLWITRSLMEEIVRHYVVGIDFVPVIQSFGQVPASRHSEQGYGCFAHNSQIDGSYDISYLHRFVDRDSPESEWKLRQIGVYHAYTKSDESHIFIFLQPHQYSLFDDRMAMIASRADSTAIVAADPFRIHEVLLGTYFGNWRWFLLDRAKTFQKDSDPFFTFDIHKKGAMAMNINFEKLQSWRDLSDRQMSLGAVFEAASRTIAELRKIAEAGSAPDSRANFFIAQEWHLKGLRSSADVLHRRILGVIDLLANTLDLKNQEDAAELNGHLYTLTRDTVDDSATVRVITLVTLVYLPASFIASIFGMNLFSFDSTTSKIKISSEFYIYIAFFVPLTFATLAVWFFLYRAAKKRTEMREVGRLTTRIAVQ